MNQILAIDNKKKNKKVKRSSTNIEIKNIVMFFAIAIIVFGLFLIGHSSYAIYVDARGNSTENLPEIHQLTSFPYQSLVHMPMLLLPQARGSTLIRFPAPNQIELRNQFPFFALQRASE